MPNIDLKKELKHLYRPSARDVVRVDVPAFRFLMIDGASDPNTSPHYARAVEALFSVSYAAKFMVKKGASGVDYAVMPLEGLWWSDDMASFVANDRTKWQWTMMIHQPPYADDAVEERGALAGKHHEIYLSDIRRAAPSRWKTIIRQPMA